jgi:carbamoyl-phosphate synthase small subunit
MDKNNAVLVLQDGTVVNGVGFGSEGTVEGELVFNTSMGGYQEALTDPSYKGQILMMTYPLIGNYGINDGDFESDRVYADGFVVRELAENPSHSKSKETLNEFLKEYQITGIQGLDTRFLTRKIRTHGVMNSILKYPYDEKEVDDIKEMAMNLKDISDLDLLEAVSVKKTERYDVGGKKTVVLIDCGVTRSVTNSLLGRDTNVVRVPAKTSPEKIMEYKPVGVVISGGPGDPKRADYVVKTVKELISEGVPIFGISLGLQILSLACGAKTHKLKFGHRGSNHPVKDLKTGRIYITSQNHGFAVDPESIPGDMEVTHVNLNDQTVEGFTHKELPITALQYYPAGKPEPDGPYKPLDEFIKVTK